MLHFSPQVLGVNHMKSHRKLKHNAFRASTRAGCLRQKGLKLKCLYWKNSFTFSEGIEEQFVLNWRQMYWSVVPPRMVRRTSICWQYPGGGKIPLLSRF